MDERDVLARVNEVIGSSGCTATGLGPDAVGVKGDDRFVGPCVYVRFPSDYPPELILEISNRITNRIPEISRVMMEISAE